MATAAGSASTATTTARTTSALASGPRTAAPTRSASTKAATRTPTPSSRPSTTSRIKTFSIGFPQPEYDESANLATATYTDQRSEPSKKQEITLITLPAFTGIAPGYPLYAAKDDIKLDIKDGLVRKATIKEPIEGPAVKVSLRYDDDGRVTRIDEDHGADGKVDRRFDYRYDEVGNVTGITLNETNFADGKKVKTKKTAKLGYKCWAPKE